MSSLSFARIIIFLKQKIDHSQYGNEGTCSSFTDDLKNTMCSSRKCPYSPHGRFFVLHPPSPPQEIPVKLHTLLLKF